MKNLTKRKIDILLIGILIFSAILNFYNLHNAGTNSYYTVAIKSMLTSFHNFFFVSFDPAGFITVDKPPVALWIQAIFAYLFGFNDFVLLLPEALAGVISVWLLYILVKPKFGRTAALISSLVLACSPIFVAIVRTNNVDSILIVTLLTATWALMKAVEKQKIGWLFVSFALIGVGFNVKMLQAYMVLPAFYFYYLFATKEIKLLKKMMHLVASTVVLIAVSLSWALAVDLTPESERPYMGGSETNSVLELAFGYNGISRLTGNKAGGDGTGGNPNQGNISENDVVESEQYQSDSDSSNTAPQPPSGFADRKGNDDGGMMGGGANQNTGMFNTGDAGPLRLFQSELSGQISWLLPFLVFVVIGLIVSFMKTKKYTMQHHFAAFWIIWLLPMLVFFSIALFYHHYYLSMMGPGIAALVGIGYTTLWNFYKEEDGWESWLLPIGVFVTFMFESLIVYQNRASVSSIWMWAGVVLGVAAFILLIVTKSNDAIKKTIAMTSILALLILPIYWTVLTITKTGNESTPTAGPTNGMGGGQRGMNGNMPGGMDGNMPGSQGEMNGNMPEDQGGMGIPGNGPSDSAGDMQGGPPENDSQAFPSGAPNMGGSLSGGMGSVNTDLLAYLEEHYNGEKFFLAVQSAQSSYSIMLNTDYAVMAMGGFSGSDPAPTVDELEEMTKNGDIKYFLISGQGMGGNNEVTEWIKENCVEVPSSEYSSSSDTTNSNNEGNFSNRGNSQTLYAYQG